MFQDPQGRGQGQGGPGPATQEPQPAAITSPRLPPLQAIDLPPLGEDSPPVQSMMQGLPQQPPQPPVRLQLPPKLPDDPREAEALLQAIKESLIQAAHYQNYQYYSQAANEIQDAPKYARQILMQAMAGVDDPAVHEQAMADLDSLEPFLPPSLAQHTRTQVTNVQQVKSLLKEFEEAYQKKVNEELDPYRKIQDSEISPLKRSMAEREARRKDFESTRRGLTPIGPPQADAEKRKALGRPAYELPTFFRDIWRGMKSPFSDIQNVQDEFMATGAKAADELLSQFNFDRIVKPIDAGGGMMIKQIEPWEKPAAVRPSRTPPEGWTRDMMRSVLAQETMRLAPKMKGDTGASDFATAVGSVAGWAVPAIGEIKLFSKALSGAKWFQTLSKTAPRAARMVEAGLAFAGGPAVFEGAWGYMRDLPASDQAEVDAITDPKLKDATEAALRTVNAVRDGATAMLFGLGDIGRAFKEPAKALARPGRALASAAGTGLAAPAALEGVESAIQWMADARASNEGTRWDAMRQLRAARGEFKPLQAIIDAKSSEERWEAIQAYAANAAPMAVGLATVHAAVGLQHQLRSRAQMLALRRKAHKDCERIAAAIFLNNQDNTQPLGSMSYDQLERELQRSGIMSDRGDFTVVADMLKARVDAELEAITPSHKEDQRRALTESIDEVTEGKAEQHVDAEQASDELLPDLQGSVTEKRAQAQRAASEADTPEEAAKAEAQLEIAERLEKAKRADDRAEALTEIELARQRAEELDRDIEPGETLDDPTVEVEPEAGVKPEAAKPEARPEPAAAKPEARPEPAAAEPEARPEPAAAEPEARPEPAAAKPPAKKRSRKPKAAEPKPKTLEEGVRRRARRAAAERADKPDVVDEPLARADRDLGREWDIIDVDVDSGKYMLRDADDPNVWLEVDQSEVGNYKIAQREEAPPVTPTEVEKAKADPEAPVPMPRIRSKEIVASMDAARAMREAGERITVRGLAERLGVSRSTAQRRLKALEDAGDIGRSGKEYVLTEEARTAEEVEAGAPTKAQEKQLEHIDLDAARDLSRVQIERELLGHMRGIEAESIGYAIMEGSGNAMEGDAGSGYTTVKATVDYMTVGYEKSHSTRIRNLVNEYAATADPKNPTRAKINIVAQLAGRLGDEAVTDARLTDTFGIHPGDVPAVRKVMAGIRPYAHDAESGFVPQDADINAWAHIMDPRKTSKGAVNPNLSWVRAMREPVLDAVSPDLADMHAKLIEGGKSQEEAARMVWDEMRETNPGMALHKVHYSDFVDGHAQIVEDVHRGMHSLDPEVHEEALGTFADMINEYALADDIVAALSMSEEGRAQLFRMFELAATIRMEGRIPSPYAMERLPRIEGDPSRRVPKRVAESARNRHLNMLTKRLQEMNSQSGAVSVDLLAGPFIGLAGAARFAFRAGRWTYSHTFKAIMNGSVRLVFDPWHSVGRAYSRWNLRRLNRRVEALFNRKAGKVKGASRVMGSAGSQLSQHADPDFVLLNETCAVGMKIALELAGNLSRIFKEDSAASYALNRWIELDGARGNDTDSERLERTNIETKVFNKEQLEVAKTVRDLYRSMRTIIANDLHPHQLLRKRNLKLLRESRRPILDKLDVLEKEVDNAKRSRDAAKDKAKKGGLSGDDLKTHMEDWENYLRAARGAASRVRKRLKKMDDKISDLEDRITRFANEWGLTGRLGYAPAVPNVDPDTLSRELTERGFADEVEIGGTLLQMTKGGKAAQMQKAEADVKDAYIHNHVLNLEPHAIKSQHWKHRKDVLEATGMRELDGVRTFAHYMRDLYRLIPAVNWLERNSDRLYGVERPLTEGELQTGRLHDNSMIDEIMVGENKTRYRLDGVIYEHKLVTSDGKKEHTVYFRSYEALKKASSMFGFKLAEELGLDKPKKGEWDHAKKQNHGGQIVLQPSRHSIGQKAKIPKTFAPEDHPVGAAFPGRDAKLMWPSQLIGEATIRQGGEIKEWQKNTSDLEAVLHSAYYTEGINTVLGRDIYTGWHRFARSVATVVSHGFLGLANPWMAIKEVVQQTFFNSVMIGVPRAMDGAQYAIEFARIWSRVQSQLRSRSRATKWTTDHKPKFHGDGTYSLEPTAALDLVRHQVKDPVLLEAFEDFLGSPVSADSVDQHYFDTIRELEYGKPLFRWTAKNAFGKVGRKAVQASWMLRRMAQTHGQRQSWFAAYAASRKGGEDRATAKYKATMFTMHQGNIANRLSQPKIFQHPLGILARPLASWQAALSSINWRGVKGPYSKDRGTKKAIASFIGRLGGLMVATWTAQQVGQLFGYDATRAIGGGASEIPWLGPKITIASHKLQALLGMYADPEDATRRPPGWREMLAEQVKQYAPDFLQEALLRAARIGGAMPADISIVPFWGTWLPLSASVLGSAGNYIDAMVRNDEKDIDRYGTELARFVAAYNWLSVWNRTIGVIDDPHEPNYKMRKAPGTGITVDRVPKDMATRLFDSLFGMPDIDVSVARVDRNVLQPWRDDLARSEAENASFRAQKIWRDYDTFQREAMSATTPEAKAVAEKLAEQAYTEFKNAVRVRGRDQQMSVAELLELKRRWERDAQASTQLATSDRSIIYAYNNEQGFARLTASLNNRGYEKEISRSRWEAIVQSWFTPEGYRKALVRLKQQNPEIYDAYRSALTAARVRWDLQEGKIPEPNKR